MARGFVVWEEGEGRETGKGETHVQIGTMWQLRRKESATS